MSELRELWDELEALRGRVQRMSAWVDATQASITSTRARIEMILRQDEGDSRADKAVDLILRFGGFDGGHHKQWVLDQVLRVLLADRYEHTIADYCAGDGGSETYYWDEGIAP